MKKEMTEKPLPVKLISILFFALSIISIILAFGFIASKNIEVSQFDKFFEGDQEFSSFMSIAINFIFIGGIVLIPIAILFLILGLGVLHGKEWARMMTIAVSILFLLFGLFETSIFGLTGIFFENILMIALSLVVGGYFLFDKRLNKFFS
ncbi:hypothetical protein EXS72_00210 [Candidatus Pacearchaeota archaeon]|nr:hypothetical protein [Candidatus Pacearchaeota archaeon]